ncbi:hypothetical protein F2P81_023837 [Scophthalmus maximus]|uniref:non-specific serine/threonine protein kinase n=1 Tax=Scophthalmus maximus TaxID=52904 RepID=A0A6A4RSE5_SCOMX|nr:hypothetical protein F2P81_023837 [Scophthalmus maximus]
MPAAAVKPSPEDMVAEGGDAGVSQWETPKPERERLPLPSLMVPRELLRSFPHSKRVGSYLVGKMINKGSFAKVMEGLHIGTGEKVAIKVIDKKKARQDSYVLKNMKREPRIHQMVRHPHIVVLFEVTDLKIENFLLDEHNNIKIVGTLTFPLSPVTFDHRDFGLSNTLKAESLSLELLNTQCGSPAYAAPELLAHRKCSVICVVPAGAGPDQETQRQSCDGGKMDQRGICQETTTHTRS